MKRPRLWALGLLLAAACGGTAVGLEVVGTEDTSPLDAGPPTTEGPVVVLEETTVTDESHEGLSDFAECLRDHGIEVPEKDHGFHFFFHEKGGPGDSELEALRRAFEECRELLGFEFPDFDERLIHKLEGFDGLRERLGEFAECLRDHGVEVPETGEGFRFFFHGNGESAELDHEAWRSAIEACRELLGLEFPDFDERLIPEFEGLDELREGLREFGECLRDQTVAPQGEVDHETWRSAIEACRELLPDRGFYFEYHSTDTAT